MNLTIIGAGNMGGATAIGLTKQQKDLHITVTARHKETFEKFADYPAIATSLDNKEAVKGADVVMLVVKPWLVKEVVEEIKPALDYNRQLIVCMAAGIKSDDLLSWLDKDGIRPSLAYIIPNTAIEVGQSMSFIAPITATKSQADSLQQLFSSVGTAIVTDEKHLSAGTALASCGIAYALRYIRAASEGGVELGFKAGEAQKIVAQTVMGAAAILEANGSHAEEEIDKVTTPGGITIKGLNAMEDAGFTAAVIAGLKASK